MIIKALKIIFGMAAKGDQTHLEAIRKEMIMENAAKKKAKAERAKRKQVRVSPLKKGIEKLEAVLGAVFGD